MQTNTPKPDARPHPPQLTDKDIDDLYRFRDQLEIEVDCLAEKLNALFHDYRLASLDWDEARGLLSPDALDGVDPEAKRERDEARARARARRQNPAAAPPAPDAAKVGAPLPSSPRGDLEGFLGDAQAGVVTLRLLWEDHSSGPHAFQDLHLPTAVRFCLDGIQAALGRMEIEIEAAASEGADPLQTTP